MSGELSVLVLSVRVIFFNWDNYQRQLVMFEKVDIGLRMETGDCVGKTTKFRKPS